MAGVPKTALQQPLSDYRQCTSVQSIMHHEYVKGLWQYETAQTEVLTPL